jgi:capsule polysaccharide export protein KpsE/RkpR
LNRVSTTKYQNKLKQLKILAATPTPGIKTLKASVKSPAKSVKRRSKNKSKLIDGGELNS